MSRNHGEALGLIARHVLVLEGENRGLATIDPEGCDLRCGGLLARVSFEKVIRDAESARVELVRLTKRARRIVAGEGP